MNILQRVGLSDTSVQKRIFNKRLLSSLEVILKSLCYIEMMKVYLSKPTKLLQKDNHLNLLNGKSLFCTVSNELLSSLFSFLTFCILLSSYS